MISCCFSMPAPEGAITSGGDRGCASSSLQIASNFNCNAHYYFISCAMLEPEDRELIPGLPACSCAIIPGYR